MGLQRCFICSVYTGIVLLKKKEENIGTSNCIGQSQNNYVVWKKPDKERYLQYDPTVQMAIRCTLMLSDRMQINNFKCWEGKERGKVGLQKGTRKLWDEEYAHCLDHGDNIIVDMCQNINFTS